jgi:hypothetical protein
MIVQDRAPLANLLSLLLIVVINANPLPLLCIKDKMPHSLESVRVPLMGLPQVECSPLSPTYRRRHLEKLEGN